MISVLKSLVPNFSHFEDRPVTFNEQTLGYQSVLITEPRHPFAGGTAKTLNDARRVCAAEAIERAWFRRIEKGSQEIKDDLLFDEHPTTCGFAAGFENRPTAFRAVCEAIERWAWSKWIDSGLSIGCAKYRVNDGLENYFALEFDFVRFFEIPVLLENDFRPDFIPSEFIFRAVIGVKGKGVFPGSRVTTTEDHSWEHPLLEAWRHKNIYHNELTVGRPSNVFDRRILYYGDDGVSILENIDARSGIDWQPAKLRILKRITSADNYFVWRAICSDFLGWEQGDETRFIY